MSVSLLVQRRNGASVSSLTPISTEEFFAQHWQPLISLLNLRWMALFQSGLPMTYEDISPILDELFTFRRYLSALQASESDPAIQHMTTRSDMLITELQAMKDDLTAEAYIG